MLDRRVHLCDVLGKHEGVIDILVWSIVQPISVFECLCESTLVGTMLCAHRFDLSKLFVEACRLPLLHHELHLVFLLWQI